MDILRKNLDLVVANLDLILANTDGKNDGPIIDALRLVESCRDMAYSMKGARRWIPIEVREPTSTDHYEAVTLNGGKRDVIYSKFNANNGNWEHGKVIFWRKKPKFPKE